MAQVNVDPIYREIASRLHMEHSSRVVRLLSLLVNPDQARILQALPDTFRDESVSRLQVSSQFARNLGMDKETADREVSELVDKGVVFPTKKGPQLPRSLIQFHDAQNHVKFYDKLGDEFFELMVAIADNELAEHETGAETPHMRCVPRWKAVKGIPGVLPHENVRAILESQELIAVLPCMCRRMVRKGMTGAQEICMNFGGTARYALSRGIGRKIEADEAFAILDKLGNQPVTHNTPNQKNVNQVLCSCDSVGCALLRPATKANKVQKVMAKSRFESTADPKKCTACSICLSMCQYGALSLKKHPEFGDKRIVINLDKCMGCGSCVINCPEDALHLKTVRPPIHIPESMGAGGLY